MSINIKNTTYKKTLPYTTNNITISYGNTKIGKVANISLLRITCKRNVPCFQKCYAAKALRLYPTVRKAYRKNTNTMRKNLNLFFKEISTFLTKKPSIKLFRYHVMGDIPSREYFFKMMEVASIFEEVNFLVFTKQYEIINAVCAGHGKQFIPNNLKIRFSAWEGLKMENPFGFPVAEVIKKAEDKKENSFLCTGHCETCLHCFESKENTTIKYHAKNEEDSNYKGFDMEKYRKDVSFVQH
jgi:hypothetical protein